jgi:hypothetical protein
VVLPVLILLLVVLVVFLALLSALGRMLFPAQSLTILAILRRGRNRKKSLSPITSLDVMGLSDRTPPKLSFAKVEFFREVV